MVTKKEVKRKKELPKKDIKDKPEGASENNPLFARGVVSFVDPEGRFQKKLDNKMKGDPTPLIIKFGVDPTRPDIHLGHAVILQKLRSFQDLGATVIFLIGDFTSMIGDPTGKSKTRPEVAQAEVEANMKTYLAQVGRILDLDPHKFSWIRNSDWFTSPTDVYVGPEENIHITVSGQEIRPNSFVGKAVLYEKTRMQSSQLHKDEVHTISVVNFLAILRKLTFARLIERDFFQERIKSGEELYLHEMMYPVFQAIDSHVLAKVYGSCDLEIGGSDQTFNMLMGRDVMRLCGQEPQAVMSLDLLEGIDGKNKMSKSLDNYIGITDEPSEMYGRTMSIPDKLISRYFALATYISDEGLREIEQRLRDKSVNPRDIKMDLAHQLVARYHGEEKAKKAGEDFRNTFQKRGAPRRSSCLQYTTRNTSC